MPTIIEYAALSQDVYVKDADGLYFDTDYCPRSEILGGHWIGIQVMDETGSPFKPGDKDFFARLYANTVTLETVVAYRGTSILEVGDDRADIQLTFNKKSQQDDDALAFFKCAQYCLSKQEWTNFSTAPNTTGHSLGGYLAQLVAISFSSVKAVIFNAPKINKLLVPGVGYVDPQDPNYKDKIYNIDLSTDCIHKIGKPVGTDIDLPGNKVCSIAENFNEILFKNRKLLDLLDYVPKVVFGLAEHSINKVVNDISANTAIAQEEIK